MLTKCSLILVEEKYATYLTETPGVIIVNYGKHRAYPETVDPFYNGGDTHRECLARRQLDVLEKHYRVQTQQNQQGDVNVSSLDGGSRSAGGSPRHSRAAVIEGLLRQDVKNDDFT